MRSDDSCRLHPARRQVARPQGGSGRRHRQGQQGGDDADTCRRHHGHQHHPSGKGHHGLCRDGASGNKDQGRQGRQRQGAGQRGDSGVLRDGRKTPRQVERQDLAAGARPESGRRLGSHLLLQGHHRKCKAGAPVCPEDRAGGFPARQARPLDQGHRRPRRRPDGSYPAAVHQEQEIPPCPTGAQHLGSGILVRPLPQLFFHHRLYV